LPPSSASRATRSLADRRRASVRPHPVHAVTACSSAAGSLPMEQGMSSGPVISPAYRQIVHWYSEFQQVQQAKPIELLVTHGAPDEVPDQPKQTDPSTQTLDIIA